MWVYLEIKPSGPGRQVELEKGEKKFGRYPVLYDATCRALAAAFPYREGFKGVVVPESLGSSYNYDVALLILQLRLETSSGIQDLPIIVQFDDEDRYVHFCDGFGMTEPDMNDIGVFLEPPDKGLDRESLRPPNKDAVQNYLVRYAGQPRFTHGRHNQANRWGPYIVSRVLELVDSRFITIRQSIAHKMFEEPYLKRLAAELPGGSPGTELLGSLRSEREAMRKRLQIGRGVRKILVVEDRLDDGWREVYSALFGSSDPGISVDWATTVNEARTKFDKQVDLVLLDVRLDPRDEGMGSSNTAVPSGVELAKWFRRGKRELPAIPILVATASNKTWIMEPLLKEGIQGYWVKDSPEQTGDLGLAVRNTIDLCRKVRDTLAWSDRTRGWVEGLYDIAEAVFATDTQVGPVLQEKAKSLHALLDRAFSPFSQDLDQGLQLNIAFLILFSCMNDLRSWCCRVKKKSDGGKNWYIVDELGVKKLGNSELLVSFDPIAKKYLMDVNDKQRGDDKFHDTNASMELLMRLGCTEQGLSFRKLRDKRNAIPLTHGVTDVDCKPGARGEAATVDDITEMLGVLRAVVEKRRPVKTC